MGACLAKIDGLTDMRAAGEIGPEEFAKKRASLLEEKNGLEKLSSNTSRRIDDWIKNGDEMFTFIVTAKDVFENGSYKDRRGVLSALGSDLVIKDKKLIIDINKSLFPLQKISKDVKAIKDRLEPLNTLDKQERFEQMCLENPVVLGCKDSNLNTQDQNLMSYH